MQRDGNPPGEIPARLALFAGLAFVLAACASKTGDTTKATSPGLEAEIVASEVLVGEQRIPIGILDHNTPVNDATVHVRAFRLAGNRFELKSESEARFKGEGLQGRGLYVAHLRLDTVGDWLAEIQAKRPNGVQGVIRRPFNVITNAIVPAPGQPAPRSHNQTVKDVPDVSYIDTGQPPDDMHELSIADAIAQHRPTLVIFASPAFCRSRVCGPEVRVVQSIEPAYRDRLTFIHVEIYRDFKPDPSKRQFTQTVLDWRLQTEPWIFLIDSRGVIRARFEGQTAADELRTAIDRFLAEA